MASIVPLSKSKTKDEVLQHLGLPQAIYSKMAREVDVAYEWLVQDKRHLVEASKRKQRPYGWSDFTSRAQDEAMGMIARSTDPETQCFWALAKPTKDCENWIARWFLYHKCRHCDGRNKSSRNREVIFASDLHQQTPQPFDHAASSHTVPYYDYTTEHCSTQASYTGYEMAATSSYAAYPSSGGSTYPSRAYTSYASPPSATTSSTPYKMEQSSGIKQEPSDQYIKQEPSDQYIKREPSDRYFDPYASASSHGRHEDNRQHYYDPVRDSNT